MSGLKSHSLAPPNSFGDPRAPALRMHTDAGGRVIFIFGDPLFAVMSTRLRRWSIGHGENCGYFGKRLEDADIIHTDHFNYERIFDSWMKPHAYPVLAIRYETLPLNHAIVEEFLGREVMWLPWKRRVTNLESFPEKLRLRVASTYASLIKKVHDAPDAKILS